MKNLLGAGRLLLGILVCLLAAPVAGAAEVVEQPREEVRLALVLSGGGARGAAHIGVLKVLEELHVVPDVIVGTSMGSIVGGLYAAGYTPEETEAILRTIDWDRVFFDRVERHDRSFRRKQDDTPYFVPFKLRFENHKPYIPAGLLAGQRLEFMLRGLVAHATSVHDFDELPIPYRAVAMDLTTSDAVVLGSGNLADAMRASMSIPGAFAPVVIDGRPLVDGGSAANLPVGIAQELGAVHVIAVNISTPLDTSVKDRSFLEVLNQLTAFLTKGSVAADIALLREGDLLIQPDLGDITFKSFHQAAEAVAIGEEAARAVADQLSRFAATPERWNEFQRVHARHDATTLPVEQVEIDYTGWVDERIVERGIDVPLNESFNEDELVDQLTDLRGLEYFGMMRYDLDVEDEATRLRIDIEEKNYGRTNLQFGASVRTDFDGDSSWALMARHQWLALNRRAAEWVNTLQIGTRSLYLSEFQQPLDWGLRWYVRPKILAGRRNLSLWFDGTRVTDYRIDGYEGAVDVGRFLGKWGDLHLTLFRGANEGGVLIGLPNFPAFDEDVGGARLHFAVDTRDQPLFPRSGTNLRLLLTRQLEPLGSDYEETSAELFWGLFLTAGRSTLAPRAEVGYNSSEATSLTSTVFLGGFGRLSGLGDDELIGKDGGVVALDYYYELFELGQGPISSRVFAGGSLEAGNTYLEDEPITWSSLRLGGSLFVGAATPLGPIHLGWGWTEPDRDRFYLIIGQRY